MSFLSKKSWHARSTKNQARVKEAEAAQEEEQKKLEQRRKELQEERELEALRKLHAKSSGSEPSKQTLTIARNIKRTTSLAWMYQTPSEASRNDKLQEEYLMGKKIPEKLEEHAIKRMEDSAGSLLQSKSANANSSTSLADVKSKLREDPLMIMKQKESEFLKTLSATQAYRLSSRDYEADLEKYGTEKHKHTEKHKDKHKEKHKDKHKHKKSMHPDDHEIRDSHGVERKRKREDSKDNSLDSHSKRSKYQDTYHESHIEHRSDDRNTYHRHYDYVPTRHRSESSHSDRYRDNRHHRLNSDYRDYGHDNYQHGARNDDRNSSSSLAHVSPEERERILAEMQRSAAHLRTSRSTLIEASKIASAEEEQRIKEAAARNHNEKLQAEFITDMHRSALESGSVQDSVSRSRHYLGYQ